MSVSRSDHCVVIHHLEDDAHAEGADADTDVSHDEQPRTTGKHKITPSKMQMQQQHHQQQGNSISSARQPPKATTQQVRSHASSSGPRSLDIVPDKRITHDMEKRSSHDTAHQQLMIPKSTLPTAIVASSPHRSLPDPLISESSRLTHVDVSPPSCSRVCYHSCYRRCCYCPQRPYRILICCVLISLFLLAAVLIGFYVYRNLHSKEHDNFTDRIKMLCRERASALTSVMGQSVSAMQGAAGFGRLSIRMLHNGAVSTPVPPIPVNGMGPTTLGFEKIAYGNLTTPHVTLKQSDFVDYLQYSAATRFIQQLVWLPYLTNTTRLIWERNTGIMVKDAPKRLGFTVRNYTYPYYLPWQYFILSGGELPDFIGLDMNILPNIEYDIIQSISSGKIWLSNRTDATNKNVYGQEQFGLYVILPVFQHQINSQQLADVKALMEGLVISSSQFNTSNSRWNDTIGVVFASIRMSSVMDATLQSLQLYPVQLDLYDLDPPKSDFAFITTGNPLNNSTLSKDDMATVLLLFGNHRYNLKCTPTLQFVNDAYSSTPLVIALGAAGIVIVNFILLVLVGFLWGWHRALHRSEQLESANRTKAEALELLEQSRAVSDNANRSKTEFLAFLCHELRNPLHAIGSMIDFMRESETLSLVAEPEDLECLATIDSQVKLMNVIVNDALDLSKIEAGKMTFEKIGFSMARLARAVVMGLNSRAKAQGITLKLMVSPTTSKWCYGDPTRIRQVLINLVSNSIKFTNVGGVTIRVNSFPIEEWDGSAPVPTVTGSVNSSKTGSGSGSSSGSTVGSQILQINPATAPSTSTPTPSQQARTNINPNANNIPSLPTHGLTPQHHQIDIPKTLPPLVTDIPASRPMIRTPVRDIGATAPPFNTQPLPAAASEPSPWSGPAPAVTIAPPRAARPLYGGFELVVSDTGCGIAEDVVPLLFQPFSQATLSVARKYGGTGLGLSIVRQIVELMGGRVSVSSTKYVGTSITVRFLLQVFKSKNIGAPGGTGTDQSDTDTPSADNSASDVDAGQPSSSGTGSESSGDFNNNKHITTSPGTGADEQARERRVWPWKKKCNKQKMNNNSHSDHDVPAHLDEHGDESLGTPWRPIRRLNPGLPSGHAGDSSGDEMCSIKGPIPTARNPEKQSQLDELMAQLRAAQQRLEMQSPGDGDDEEEHDRDNEPHIQLEGELDLDGRSCTEDPGFASTSTATGVLVRDRCSDGDERKDRMTGDRMPTGQRVLFGLSAMLPQEAITPPSISPSPEVTSQLIVLPPVSDVRTIMPTRKLSALSQSQQLQTQTQTQQPQTRYHHDPATSNTAPAPISITTNPSIPFGSVGRSPTPPLDIPLKSISSRSPSSSSIPLPRALVVDDSDVNLKILVRLLSAENCICDIALDGQQALDAIGKRMHEFEITHGGHATPSSTPPDATRTLASDFGMGPQYDIIFSDVVMPVMDGLSLSRAIRTVECEYSLPPVPIVALTANAMEHDRTACFQAGMTHFLAKPFNKGQFKQVLYKALPKAHNTPNNTNHTHPRVKPRRVNQHLNGSTQHPSPLDYSSSLPSHSDAPVHVS